MFMVEILGNFALARGHVPRHQQLGCAECHTVERQEFVRPSLWCVCKRAHRVLGTVFAGVRHARLGDPRHTYMSTWRLCEDESGTPMPYHHHSITLDCLHLHPPSRQLLCLTMHWHRQAGILPAHMAMAGAGYFHLAGTGYV